MEAKKGAMGKLALALCLGGVVLAVIVAMRGRPTHQHSALMAYLVFVAFQIAALGLGVLARESKFGKTAIVTASVLQVGSFTVIS